MYPEMKKVIRNVNSSEEIRKPCSSNKQLEKDLSHPKTLIEQVFQSLKIFQPSTNLSAYSNELAKAFGKNILSLNLRSNFTKRKYPKFYDFYTKYSVNQTYQFHVFKCLQPDCEWHSPIKSGKIEPSKEPVPEEGPNGVTHHVQGNDPTEKFLPSRLGDPSKCNMACRSRQLHKQL